MTCMKIIIRKSLIVLAFAVVFVPVATLAHQPRIVEGTTIDVINPEISKAYYGTISDMPHSYKISSDKPFPLYLNLLVPDRPGQTKTVWLSITRTGVETNLMRIIDGTNFDWKPMYEEFGADNYLKGPEFKQEMPAGDYVIVVGSWSTPSRYVLAIGDVEAFDLKETVNALIVIPLLKADFFGSSPFTFLRSPFGIGYIVIMFVFAFIAGFIYKWVWRKLARGKVRKAGRNIGGADRVIRAVLGLGLLVAGIYFWNPVLLFFAGFCFFEAIFSWCGLYAALGKHSCPL
jgi:hypothetical protein